MILILQQQKEFQAHSWLCQTRKMRELIITIVRLQTCTLSGNVIRTLIITHPGITRSGEAYQKACIKLVRLEALSILCSEMNPLRQMDLNAIAGVHRINNSVSNTSEIILCNSV